MTIWVQYRTETKDGDWTWFPGNPADSDQALSYTLEPGETVDLKDNDWQINASQIRFWAKSDTKEWANFKNKDLWLVPETDSEGKHGYSALDMETFDLTLR